MKIETITEKEAIEISYKTAILVQKGWTLDYSGEWIHPEGLKFQSKKQSSYPCGCCYKDPEELDAWPFEEACELENL